jgi:hypothetical protein
MSMTYETLRILVVLYKFILVSLKWGTAGEFSSHWWFCTHGTCCARGPVNCLICNFFGVGVGGWEGLIKRNFCFVLHREVTFAIIVHKSECQNLKRITVWKQSLSLKISVFGSPYFIFFPTLCNSNESLTKLFKPHTRVMKAGFLCNNSSF